MCSYYWRHEKYLRNTTKNAGKDDFGVFVCFSHGILTRSSSKIQPIWAFVCLPRKFMSLNAKVWFAWAWFGSWVYGFGCFARDMGLGFGWNLGLGVLLFVGDWIWGRTPRKTQRTWTCYSEKIMKGIKKEWHLINLFHVDIFGYKESTRKAK